MIIKIKDLNKSYGSGETKVEALKNINLEIKKGSFVAIVGASGSGKSTLLHLLGGVDRPTSGSVEVNNLDVYSLNEEDMAIFRRRNVGFIFQSYNLVPVLNVEENIKLPLLLDKKEMNKEYFNELIDILALKERLDYLPNQLSGGQQQRVSIGRALSYNPAIVLADEPTGNLDSESSKDIMDLLKVSIKKYNQTLILVTHDLEIASMADRIITIGDGQVIGDQVVRNEKL